MSRRKEETKESPWKGLKPAKSPQKQPEAVPQKGRTAAFNVNTDLMEGVANAYRRRHPGSALSGSQVIHAALKAYMSELKFQARLMDKLKSELSA